MSSTNGAVVDADKSTEPAKPLEPAKTPGKSEGQVALDLEQLAGGLRNNAARKALVSMLKLAAEVDAKDTAEVLKAFDTLRAELLALPADAVKRVMVAANGRYVRKG